MKENQGQGSEQYLRTSMAEKSATRWKLCKSAKNDMAPQHAALSNDIHKNNLSKNINNI